MSKNTYLYTTCTGKSLNWVEVISLGSVYETVPSLELSSTWRKLCQPKQREVLVVQLCLTLCNPMDGSLPGSSVHGILPARILEWVAILFSRGSSWPRDRTQVFSRAGRFLYSLSQHGSPWNKMSTNKCKRNDRIGKSQGDNYHDRINSGKNCQ